MIAKEMKPKEMSRILEVMPDEMIVYKLAFIKRGLIRTADDYHTHPIDPMVSEMTIQEKFGYWAIYRPCYYEPGLNRTGAPGFHCVVKPDAIINYWNTAMQPVDQALGMAHNRHYYKDELEIVQILKCLVHKNMVRKVGYEAEGALVVCAEELYIPGLPCTDIRDFQGTIAEHQGEKAEPLPAPVVEEVEAAEFVTV